MTFRFYHEIEGCSKNLTTMSLGYIILTSWSKQ